MPLFTPPQHENHNHPEEATFRNPFLAGDMGTQSMLRKMDALDEELNVSNAGNNRWILPYADLLTLLLGLFIVMFVFAYQDNQVLDSGIKQLQAELNQQEISSEEIYQMSAQSIERAKEQKELAEELTEKLAQIEAENLEDSTLDTEIDPETRAELPEMNGVEIKQESRGTVISIANNLLFTAGSADLSDAAQVKLNEIAGLLNESDHLISVEGHTDDSVINTSQFPSNWELSTARATNIVKYLVKTADIKPERLSATGYGEFRPIAKNSSIEGKRKNRRVDIVLLGGISTPQPKLDQNLSDTQSEQQTISSIVSEQAK